MWAWPLRDWLYFGLGVLTFLTALVGLVRFLLTPGFRIGSVEKRFDDLAQGVHDLITTVSRDLRDDVKDLRKEVQDLGGEVRSLSTFVYQLNDHVGAEMEGLRKLVGDTLRTTKEEVRPVKADVDTLKETIIKLNSVGCARLRGKGKNNGSQAVDCE